MDFIHETKERDVDNMTNIKRFCLQSCPIKNNAGGFHPIIIFRIRPDGTMHSRTTRRFCVCKICLFQYLFAVSLTSYSGLLQAFAGNFMIEKNG